MVPAVPGTNLATSAVRQYPHGKSNNSTKPLEKPQVNDTPGAPAGANRGDLSLEAIARALAKLSPEERAKLAGMLTDRATN